LITSSPARFISASSRSIDTRMFLRSGAELGAATVEPLAWTALAQCTPHDLALFVHQDARGVRGDLVYNAERFSPALAARAAARLGQLIDTNATAPSLQVGALPRGP
jgi:hypothetical protein